MPFPTCATCFRPTFAGCGTTASPRSTCRRSPAVCRASQVAAMKFTLAWLKDHLDTSASLAALTETLSAIGLEVEGVEDRGAKLAAFSVARVLEAKQHPNADKLRACKVDTGHGIVEVVCGAPNACTGLIGVFAPVGSYIPGKKL